MPTDATNKKLSFAERQLLKMGWQQGKGLGKHEDGIAAAIRVDVKKDTEGIGAKSDQFGFQWWDHLFNKAASNIVCCADSDVGDGDGDGAAAPPKLGQRETSVRHRHELIDVHRPTAITATASNVAGGMFVKSG